MPPISPENRKRYPRNWHEYRAQVRERSGNRCEGSPAYPDCRAVNGDRHPVTNSVVVLTTAHLDHTPENCDLANLRHWCQRCHLTYDVDHHAESRYMNKHNTDPTVDMFNSPRRIQRNRQKGWRMPPGAVYVGRPSKWGNRFTIEASGSAQQAVDDFKYWMGLDDEAPDNFGLALRERAIRELRGKDLVCWCPLASPCHADVLLELVNRPAPDFRPLAKALAAEVQG